MMQKGFLHHPSTILHELFSSSPVITEWRIGVDKSKTGTLLEIDKSSTSRFSNENCTVDDRRFFYATFLHLR